MTIYAVDDESLALELVEDVVTQTVPDCTFGRFSDGASFLEAMRRVPADVALVDVEMPEMNGVELAIRAQELHEKVNVIFLTGYTQYAVDAMDIFASGYVLKPITPEKLRTQLAHLRHAPKVSTGLTVQTRPVFSVLLDGDALPFRRRKTHELLAYLIYLRGQKTTAVDIRRALFGRADGLNTRTNSYFHHLKKDLSDTMEQFGLGEMVDFADRDYAVHIPDLPDAEEIQAALKKQYEWAK